MTMLSLLSSGHCAPAALPVYYLLLIFVLAAGTAVANPQLGLSTTTTTVLATTTIRTLTTTITSGQTTFASTETLTPGTTIYYTGPTATPTMSLGSGHGAYSGNTFKNAVLNSTNLYRSQHAAKPLKWNDTLATYAQNYAQKCMWEHSGGPHGENLAEGYANPTLAIDAWGNEEKNYDYESAQFSEATGHFTQLVWEGTTSVGCGAVNCGSANGVQTAFNWYLVCEYNPPGNVIGRFKSNVKVGKSKDGMIGLGGAGRTRVGGVLIALVLVTSMMVAWV